MSLYLSARVARFVVRQPSSRGRRRPLRIDLLEDRAVPANNITVMDALFDDSAEIDVKTTGQTTTISPLVPDAHLSIETIRTALADAGPQGRDVVITTDVAQGGTDGNEAGDIVWDATSAGSLDFFDFGTGKTLIFRTVNDTNATGNITLTAVEFLNDATDDQISLQFDTSATNGDVLFQHDSLGSNTVLYSAEAILDLTVNAGTGTFNFADDGINISAADAGGAVSITAGDVSINHLGGLTAGTDITIAANSFTLSDGAGVFATGNLGITSTTTATIGDNAGASADGSVAITADDITAGAAVIFSGADLTLDGATSVDLTFSQPNAGGDLTITGGTVNVFILTVSATGALTVTGTTSLTTTFSDLTSSGDVTVSGGQVNVTNGNIETDGSISVAGTTVNLANVTATAGEDGHLEVTGGTIGTTDVVLSSGSGLAIHGPVTATGLLDIRSVGAILVDGTVDGAAEFFVDSRGSVTFQQDVGSGTAIGDVTFNQGNVNFGSNDLTATSITVGASLEAVEAILGSAGTVTGNMTVQKTGNLAPGGLGTVGNMTVRGNILFQTPSIFGAGAGGDLAIDFGPGGTADRLIVVDNPLTLGPPEGNVDLSAGAMLGGGLGTGMLTGPSAVIVDPSGAVIGQFTNAPIGAGLIVGTDAITVMSYSPDVVVAPMAATPNGIAVGADPDDGTGFRAVLTGGGQLVVGKDWRGFLFLVVRNSTPLSKLTITTTANGADDVVTFNAGVLINGNIAAVNAPKVNIGSQFRATGFVKSAVIRDLTNLDNARIEFGGTAVTLSTIRARNIFGSLITGSTLTSLKVAQNLGAQVFVPFLPDSVVSAPAIGAITAKGLFAMVNVNARLNSLLISGDAFGGVSAGSLGTFSAGSFQGDVDITGAATTIKTTRRFDGNIAVGSVATFNAGGGSINLDSTGRVGTIIGRTEGLAIDVTANSVGAVRVTGGLSGNGLEWNVTNGIGRLTADVIGELNVRAGFLGPLLVTGNPTLGFAGDIVFSTFTLTGNDGTAGEFGLKSLTAKGRVDGTLIDVQQGNVGAVTVGRFYFSQLHVNYTPDLAQPFDLGGTFGPRNFRLASFKTTALPTADPDNFFHWAFRGSEIAAESIGTVTLSGLNTDNLGTAFGIKVQNPSAIVKVLRADAGFPANLLNVALTPDPFAIGGDFFFLDV